jgi:hypothetical protein
MRVKIFGSSFGFSDSEEPNMQAVTTIGLDIAKSVFSGPRIDVEGLRRSPQRQRHRSFFAA